MDFTTVAEMAWRISTRSGAIKRRKVSATHKQWQKAGNRLKAALRMMSPPIVEDVPPPPIAVAQRLASYVRRSQLSLVELFAMIDKDGSGSVDIAEFRTGLRSVGLTFSDLDLEALLKLVDTDGDGQLDCNEFCSRMEEILENEASSSRSVLTNLCNYLHMHGTSAQELLERLDEDNTGDLDAKEFHAILVQIGINVSESAARRAMNSLDMDGDGTLEISELATKLEEFQRQRRVFAAKTLGKICDYVKMARTSVARVFSRVDVDGSGSLDVLEMQEAFRKMGQDLGELEVEQMMQELGGTSSATMTTLQFLDKMKQFEAERSADMTKCKALFQHFDSDCSGSLDRKEVKLLAGEMGLAKQVEDPDFLSRLIADIEDARLNLDEAEAEEQDGTVSLEELLPWFLANGRSYLPRPVYAASDDMVTPSAEELRSLFDEIDADNSGGVNQAEAQEAVATMFPYIGLRSSKIAYDAADADGSGAINKEEFASLFTCLAYLNKRRHTIDEIFEQFDDGGVDEGNFFLATTLLKVDLSDIEATRYFTMLTLHHNVDTLEPDQLLAWLVRRECIDKLDSAAQEEQIRQWQIAQLDTMAGEYGDVYMEDLAEVLIKGMRRRKAQIDGTEQSDAKNSKSREWKQRMSNAAKQTLECTSLLQSAFLHCLKRNESFPDISEEAVSDMLSSLQSEVYFSGQSIITQGMAESAFFIIRRGAANVLLDDVTIVDTVRAGNGVGELSMLFDFKRNATIQCIGPCEVYRLERADYETSVALMPAEARKSALENMMDLFWSLVTGPGGSRRPEVDYKIYLQLSVRINKTLTTQADMEAYDEEEQREIAQIDWGGDCQRYGLKTTESLQQSHFFNSIYELVDLWAADLDLSFTLFLRRLFDNIAEWTDELGGHWRFKQLDAVRCDGEKFEALKEDARAAAEEAERVRKAQEMEWEQGRLKDEMLAKERKEKLKALQDAQEAEESKVTALRQLQMRLLALDDDEAELRRRLAAGGLTPKEEEELRRRLAAIQQERIQVKRQILEHQEEGLRQQLASGSVTSEEAEEIRRTLADLEQARWQLQVDALSVEGAELHRKLASGLLSIEDEEAARRRLAAIAQETNVVHTAKLNAEEAELQRRLAAGSLSSSEAQLLRTLARDSGLVSAEEEEEMRQRLAALAQQRIAVKLRALDMEEEELLRRLAAGGLSPEEEEDLRQRLADIEQERNRLQLEALELKQVELHRRGTDGNLSAKDQEAIKRRLAAIAQESVQLKIDALAAEEAELRRRLAGGLLSAEEGEALRQRLAAIDQKQIQLNITKLNLQKSELQRRLASGSLSTEEEHEIRERLDTISSELGELQVKAFVAEEAELQRRVASGKLSFEEESELRKRLAQMNAERSHFSIDTAAVETVELRQRRRLCDDSQSMPREQEAASETRFAVLEQQVDALQEGKLDMQHSGCPSSTFRTDNRLTDHSELSQGGASSQCEFEDETRMFVSFLQGTHSPLRPVSPLRPRASTCTADASTFSKLGIAQEMDILEEWKRIRTSVRHGGTGKSRWMVDKTVRNVVGARTDTTSKASRSTSSLPTLGRSQETPVRRQRGRRRRVPRSKSTAGHSRPEKTRKSKGRRDVDLPVLRMMATQHTY